jgi:PAS domain S-box-containing protein/putative nucleotidyltransferase with HDIG domain
MKVDRVLIVDDREESLYLLRALLQGHGYEVASAANGAEALDAARKDLPDLIIADILMPVMDGFALCREWKKDEALKSIPFVFYTATYTDERDREFALSLGAERFIVKPEEPDALVAIVRETIQHVAGPSAAQTKPAAASSTESPTQALQEDEHVYLQHYNAALVRKLEAKMQQLEGANRELERDVVARQMVEDALRQSEGQLRTLIDTLPDLVWLKDPEGVYLSCNRRFERFFGAAEKDIVGKTDYDFIDKDLADAFRQHDKAALAAKGPTANEEAIVFAEDGHREILETIKMPVQASDGRLIGVLGVSRDITKRRVAEEEVRHTAKQLRRTVEGAVLAMSRVVETRDPYTAGHERRVAELATAIAADLGMEGEELTALRLGALIHDIGKIGVPAEILAKPGRLSEVEFSLIKQHPAAGFDILGAIDFGRPVAEMVRQHHERLDGSGYPRGLKGKDILPEARILAVADVVEAMSSHRPYRAELGMEAALAEVREHAGITFDVDVVEVCVRLVEEQGFQFTP